MKRKIATITVIFFAAFLISFNIVEITSTGAPIGSSGAPGDYTCAKSGCHADNQLNAGVGSVDVKFDNYLTAYQPKKTYEITISVHRENISRFGFQVLVLRKADSSNVGTLQLTDSLRTQIFKGTNQYLGKNYLTYTALGTKFSVPGLGQWKFKWTAPDKDMGPVTFYAATVAANNDGTDNGDWVYTHSLTVSSNAPSATSNKAPADLVHIFPNPVNDKLTVVYTANTISYCSIKLCTLLGQPITDLWHGISTKGNNSLEIPVNASMENGIYFLEIKIGNNVYYKKVLLNKNLGNR